MNEISDREEIIDLDDLKNPDAVKSVSFEINEDASCTDEDIDINEMTSIEYKKFLKKKVSQFTEEEKAHYNKLAQKKKRQNDKTEEEKKEIEKNNKLEDDKKSQLYNQLFVLKEKFADHTENIHISKDMNIKTLEEKKDLIVKIITEKHSHSVVFESLLLLCRTGERTLDYFDVDVLDGYAQNVEEAKEDIIPVLREMIDLGEIDTSMLTPQLRLAVIMSSVAVKTMEKNNDKKNLIGGAENVDTS